jgi:hypothetical protein
MEINYENRKFMIFNISEINNINFNEVLENSIDTVRISLNGLKTFVKWDSDITPSSIDELKTKEGPYNYDEILIILSTDDWSTKFIDGEQ